MTSNERCGSSWRTGSEPRILEESPRIAEVNPRIAETSRSLRHAAATVIGGEAEKEVEIETASATDQRARKVETAPGASGRRVVASPSLNPRRSPAPALAVAAAKADGRKRRRKRRRRMKNQRKI
jgi:hypothetical protein